MGDQTAAADDAIGAFLEARRDEMVDRLSAWVEIPSVSADPERRIDGVRSAHWIAAELRDAGFTTTLLPAGDAVTVFAERDGVPRAPTVLVYTHHDVRHAKPEEWSETAPFVPVLREGCLYGRGASDAKGQALAHVWAQRALAAVDGPDAGVHLKVLVDGEEEIGSPYLENLLAVDPDRFACDLVVFSDTLQWGGRLPGSGDLDARHADRDAHGAGARPGCAQRRRLRRDRESGPRPVPGARAAARRGRRHRDPRLP